MRCACGCEFEPGPSTRANGGGATGIVCPRCGTTCASTPPGTSSVTELQPIESSGSTVLPNYGSQATPAENRPTEVPAAGQPSVDSGGTQTVAELESLSGLGWKLGQTVLDRFKLREIRVGGMGVVYIAEDLTLQRDVAIKTLQKRCLERPGSSDRFLQECIIWIRLTERHPNIVQAYFAKRHGDYPLLFLEFVDGLSLRARMREGRLRVHAALDIAMQVCFGLLYAWEQHSVVHRDIKPENILMTRDGAAKITDFGLATINTEALQIVHQATTHPEAPAAATNARLTQIGEIVGTIPYMSPEQIQGDRPLDTRSDIYSFGLTLYEMLSHRHPFHGVTLTGLPNAILYDQPKQPSLHNRDLQEMSICYDLDRLVMRCLEKDPERRTPSFADLLDDLERIGAVIGVEPHYEIDKRFMLIGPKEWKEKIASLRELGAEQEARDAEEESRFQAALGVDHVKSRSPIVTRGDRRRATRVKKKNTVLRSIGGRQLLVVFETPLPTYDPDLLLRQLQLNGWFHPQSPIWGRELKETDGYVVRIFRSGGVEQRPEALPSLIVGSMSEALLSEEPKHLAQLPPFYVARQWSELTPEEELSRIRAMLSARVQSLPPDDHLELLDFDYEVRGMTLAHYQVATATDERELASGTLQLDLGMRRGASHGTLREYWEALVLPPLKENRSADAWKACWKMSALLQDYRATLAEGTAAELLSDLVHMLGCVLHLLGKSPEMRELSRPFPHLELRLRRGLDPAGRRLAPDLAAQIAPYLYGGMGAEELPVPRQAFAQAGEHWAGAITLPITLTVQRVVARRTEARKPRGPGEDPEG